MGENPGSGVARVHQACIERMLAAAGKRRLGAIPSRIDEEAMASLSDEMRKDFMGYGNLGVRFLGHGVVLHVDELPVIATGFYEPLEENMVVALEPKRGLARFGTVGVEDTFVVTRDGGRWITGGPRENLALL